MRKSLIINAGVKYIIPFFILITLALGTLLGKLIS